MKNKTNRRILKDEQSIISAANCQRQTLIGKKPKRSLCLIFIAFMLYLPVFGQEGARYLIITHSNFYDCIQPLADWKNKKGMKCKVAQLSETGSTPDSIKNYIVNAYNTWNPRPEYILLVGSPNFVPSYNNSDDYYANVTGNYRIELSIGRFHCANLTQCSVMVRKTISYEKNDVIQDSTWHIKGTTIVREDNPPDPYYQADCRYIRNLWLAAGFIHVDSFLSTRGDNQDSVYNAINNGRAFVVFRGQSVGYWWSPFYVRPHYLNNGFKLPIVVSGTCANLTLVPNESMLGDAFLRVGTVENPKGAVGFFGTNLSGSGISQYRSAVTKGFFTAIFQESIFTLGGAAKRGKYIMDSLLPNQTRYREWNLLGDPELNILTQIPKPLTVIYPETIAVDSQDLVISVQKSGSSVPNALVCLWKGDEVYAYDYTNATGSVTLTVRPLTPGKMFITVTAWNSLPFEDIITCVEIKDVGTTAIVGIPALLDSGVVITPACTVFNYGTTAENYRVRMKIGTFYNDTAYVLAHLPQTKRYVAFPPCSNWQRGNFVVACSTELVGDENSANDRDTLTIRVKVNDVGAIRIVLPLTVTIGNSLAPICTVYNYGTETENYRVRMKIGTFYNDSASVSDHLPGTKIAITFPSLTFNQLGSFPVSCSTELVSDLQPMNDKIIGSVLVQTIGWVKKTDIRGQPSGKGVKSGGGITLLGNDIYLILGNNTLDFMKYSITSLSWTVADSIPAGPKNKKVKKGGYIISDENYVYVVKGGGTNEFYQYNPETNSWHSLPSPNFSKGIKGGFAEVVELAGTKYIYCGSGANNNEWKRYNLNTNTWEPAYPANLPVEKAKAGSGLVFDGENKLYFLLSGGKENNFYSTDLSMSSPSWVTKKAIPLYSPVNTRKRKVKEGGALVYFQGKIYAVKGGNTKEFWSYLPESDEWVYVNEVGTGSLTPPAKGIKCAKSLTASANGIYCLIGNKTNEFWFYGGVETKANSSKPALMADTIKANEFSLRVMPNPSAGKITIHFDLPIKTTASLVIYNVLGEIVHSVKTFDQFLTVENLTPGIYFLAFSAGDYKVSKKLIVTR